MLTRKGVLLGTVVIACGLFVATLVTGRGWTGQIRLDCGDLRYCLFGIPLTYDSMPEPWRSSLIAVVKASPVARPVWRTCVTYPLPTSNNSDRMCRRFYCDAAAWVAIDPAIARFAVEDIADYINKTNARYA